MWLFNDLLLNSSSFPLISLNHRFFCAGTIVLPAWKPLSWPSPSYLSRTNFHALSASLVFFLTFFISTAGTVRFSRRFHPESTTNNSNLQGNREKLINFKSEWNYVRISKTKAPPPPHSNSRTYPPTLCKSSNQISQWKVDTN